MKEREYFCHRPGAVRNRWLILLAMHRLAQLAEPQDRRRGAVACAVEAIAQLLLQHVERRMHERLKAIGGYRPEFAMTLAKLLDESLVVPPAVERARVDFDGAGDVRCVSSEKQQVDGGKLLGRK